MLLMVLSSENKTCKSNVRLSRDSAVVSFHSAVIPAAGVRRPRPQEDTNISHALSKRSCYTPPDSIQVHASATTRVCDV